MEEAGGAWCPSQQIASGVYEWLQVDLGGYRLVTLVETQGRFGAGQVGHEPGHEVLFQEFCRAISQNLYKKI